MLLMVARQGVALQHASCELRGDEELVRAAMSSYVLAFQYASETLKSDRQFAEHAVKASVRNLLHVPDDLKADRNFILNCLIPFHEGNSRSYTLPSILQKLPDSLHGDRAVVLRALLSLPLCHRREELLRARKDLHSDEGLRAAAGLSGKPVPSGGIRTEAREPAALLAGELPKKQAFWHKLLDNDKLRLDLDLVSAALEDDASVYELLPEAMRCREQIALLAFRRHRIKLPKPLLSNRNVVVEAAAIQVNASDVEKRRLQKLPLTQLVAKFELA